MLRLSNKADYALLAMRHLAAHADRRPPARAAIDAPSARPRPAAALARAATGRAAHGVLGPLALQR